MSMTDPSPSHTSHPSICACREQATVEINDLRQKLAGMSEELSSMSAKLGEANEQLAFNMAKRQTSR